MGSIYPRTKRNGHLTYQYIGEHIQAQNLLYDMSGATLSFMWYKLVQKSWLCLKGRRKLVGLGFIEGGLTQGTNLLGGVV